MDYDTFFNQDMPPVLPPPPSDAELNRVLGESIIALGAI